MIRALSIVALTSFALQAHASGEVAEAMEIEGAVHIEWREVFSRLDEIPKDRKTILFCNTGALSAQAAFGLRVLGYENVLILQGGYTDWVAVH